MEYVLGVDIGTTGARAALVSVDGELVHTAYTTHNYKTPFPGWVEQDAEVYWGSFCKVVKDVVSKCEQQRARILALSVSALAPDVLPIDKKGEPLHPAILWLDRRALEEAKWLEKKIGVEKIFQLTGNVIDPYFGLVKLLWFRNKKEYTYNKAYKILNVKDYIVYKITGEIVTDYSHAACTGIAYDIRKKEWDREMFKEIGLEMDKMPQLVSSDKVIGKVQNSISEITGLKVGTPVVAGAADAIANIVSTGITEEGESAMSLGTSGIWGILNNSDKFARNMLNSHAVNAPDMFLTVAAPAFTGGVYQWWKDNIMKAADPEITYEIMNKEAEGINPGSDGLITLPYFGGERTPIWDPLARGVILGFSIDHTRGHIFRSAIEGMAFAFLDNLKYIKKSGIHLKNDIIVTGGGAKSKLIREVLANALGMNTIYIGGNISAEVGDAFIAGKGIGLFKNFQIIKDKLTPLDKISPDRKISHIYEAYYDKIYKNLYPLLKEIFQYDYELRKGMMNMT